MKKLLHKLHQYYLASWCFFILYDNEDTVRRGIITRLQQPDPTILHDCLPYLEGYPQLTQRIHKLIGV